MPKELAKTYNPHEMEDRIYGFWMDGGYFRAEIDPDKTPFTIVIPPPNVTGQLHMGHALDETLQDILIRYKRMQGYSALWLPGTDHAGIATQIKVEETLREEGLSRHDLGREQFLERVWRWKELYGSRIINQLKKLGSSCDWSRERFTMDEGCSQAVREVFVDLYQKGLIYQGNRIINWCPNCITALSDAEVEYKEMDGHFWHVSYPLEDGTGHIEIATTRPETMLGDTAVVVHPDDERYAHLKGQNAILPLMDRKIPVIFDEYVDKEFGTGAMKVTPCHDPNDFELGKKHRLPEIKVMDDYGKINGQGGKYAGLDRYEARERIVEDLKDLGLLKKTEPHAHNVGTCYRCHTVVEPITSKQWFVKMAPLAVSAIGVVKNGGVKFVPERFSKTYLNWMENVHDWCISRQLWWGHRIPAFYCDSCGEISVSKEALSSCPKCGHTVRQDEDVLDTWFSSALWPFSTLGWPDKTPDLDYFYPTSVLVTGYDIIFFWVARMIFSAMEQMKDRPFDTVLIHGLVRDGEGRKMSKSLGNGIDPLEVIEKYGADALRFTLASGNSPGNDMRFYWEKVESGRNFANKLWNASRFVLLNLTVSDKTLPESLEPEDKWILSIYNSLVREVTENLDKFEIGIALGKLYDFIWDIFCDWYIEIVKPRLGDKNENAGTKLSAQKVLLTVLEGTLKLLHPYMPFITEEIFQSIPHEGESLMGAEFPVYDESLSFPEEEELFTRVLGVIRVIRNKRSELSVPPSKKIGVIISTDIPELFDRGRAFILRLAGGDDLLIVPAAFIPPDGCAALVTDGAKVYLPLGQMVDAGQEKKRLSKELVRLSGEIGRLSGKLANEGFLKKAPASVVAEERKKLEKYRAMKDEVELSLAAIGK